MEDILNTRLKFSVKKRQNRDAERRFVVLPTGEPIHKLEWYYREYLPIPKDPLTTPPYELTADIRHTPKLMFSPPLILGYNEKLTVVFKNNELFKISRSKVYVKKRKAS